MIIKGTFYRLTPINDSSSKFDLELLRDIGGKNPRKEFKVEGYGLPLEVALERCRNYATRKNLGEEVSLKEYIDELKKQTEIIISEIRPSMSVS